jgi:hypothetical protein
MKTEKGPTGGHMYFLFCSPQDEKNEGNMAFGGKIGKKGRC